MVKYSSFLLIASIWLFTVSCLAMASDTDATSKLDKLLEDLLGSFTTLATDLKDISGSSNVFVKMMRDMAGNIIEKYEKDKKQIKDAVTKGIEMEKKIQSLSQSLKNSTIPLTKKLQAEVDAIGKHATSELNKLKGMENDKDIEGIEKEAKTKHAEIKVKIQELLNEALTMVSTAKTTATTATTTTEKISTELKTKLLNLKTKAFAIIHESVPVALAAKNNEEIISNKMTTTYTTLSKIRNDLDRMEKIQFDMLSGYKEYYGTDAASLACSLLTPCVFAILLGMIF